MQFKKLQDKIEHARSITDSLPPLPFQDIRELLEERSQNRQNYLTYVDEQDERTEITYVVFYEQVLGCARFLQNHGLSRGDRIATISHNHWHTVVQYFAAWLLGLVVVPVNLGQDDERIAYILENGQIELAFVRTEYRDRFRKILERHDQLKHIEWIVCEGGLENFTKEDGKLQIDQESYAESEALIVFTSGTTGPPKGVMLSQRNLLEDARSISDWHGIHEESRMMCVLPIHHVNGIVVTMITPFYAGGSTVLNQKFRVGRFFSLIQEEQVHIVCLVSRLLKFLNSYYENRNQPDTPSLRHVICGDGPLTVQVAQTFISKFDVPVIHGYELPESTSYSTFIPIDLDDEELEKWLTDFDYPSIGIPIPANEMAVHDENGNVLGEEERGEIVIRGVNVMRGYYNNREANEKAFKNGWFRSGDEGFYINDKRGRPYFFITGRLEN